MTNMIVEYTKVRDYLNFDAENNEKLSGSWVVIIPDGDGGWDLWDNFYSFDDAADVASDFEGGRVMRL